ncbi:DNA primase TraC [Variovorax sp. WDL1]|nr:Antirestriction protein [Variovorax sp. WDL1]PNG53314.1 DNA primase TraC [Variovorax sp. B2]PNG53886.1 DNA primase TraC [Variovorax sp. B4]VTV11351.1 DNA primase TraC [Variovorax sp. WDL1]
MKTTKTSCTKTDVYARVTDRIVSDLEKGVRPWMKPWSADHASDRLPSLPLRHNGTPYRGVNVLLLWGEMVEKGYDNPLWMTYKQAEALGANVRKGEHGSLVVYADTYAKTEENDKGEEIERAIPFMKGYTVFNVAQIEGLPAHYYHPTAPRDHGRTIELIEEAEAFFNATGAAFRHGGNRAFYAPSADFIQLPPAAAFRDAESYAGTKAHELVHWTGNEKRMAREFGKRFGDKAYAFEELVAELGAAFLCADLGITPEVREDHAAYLAHWLEVLKDDKRAIFSAAAHAQRALDFLHNLQRTEAGGSARRLNTSVCAA